MYNELRKGMQPNFCLRFKPENAPNQGGTRRKEISRWELHPARADEGNRTPNLLITNQLLCQLSYVSQWAEKDNLLAGRASAAIDFRDPLSLNVAPPLQLCWF